MGYLNTLYAYAIGRIRVLETRLLNQNAVDRMLGAKNAEEAFKVLHDLDLASHSTDIDKVEDFQEVVNIDLKETKELLEKITPYKDVLRPLWYYYDIHNIKTIIRANNQNLPHKESETNILQIGWLSHNLYEKYIEEGIYSERIPMDIKEIIDTALSIYEHTQNINAVDHYLDKQYYVLIYKIIKKTKNEFLMDYYCALLDASKILAAMRMKNIKMQMMKEHNIFELESKIKTSIFNKYFTIENVNDANSFLLESLQVSDYHEVLRKGLEYFNEYNSFLKLEIEFDNFITKHLQKAKIIPFGPEPLFAYFLAKRNNAQIIYTIMVGKINEINEKIIKNRLCNLYI